MEMTDGAHVPCEDLPDGARRFIWDLPAAQIVIDVHPDGRIVVNGGDVERVVPLRTLPLSAPPA